MRMPPLLADFIHAGACIPICEKFLTRPDNLIHLHSCPITEHHRTLNLVYALESPRVRHIRAAGFALVWDKVGNGHCGRVEYREQQGFRCFLRSHPQNGVHYQLTSS